MILKITLHQASFDKEIASRKISWSFDCMVIWTIFDECQRPLTCHILSDPTSESCNQIAEKRPQQDSVV